MKITGIIAEYNPFHNGHQYHIEKARKLTGADAIIVVMSGDFVQRGIPAIMPKHLRAHMSLQSGASLVLELPVRFATGTAETFAYGAVALLDRLGCVDSICFGSECGDVTILNDLAGILCKEPLKYKDALGKYLKQGDTFPLARQKAVADYLGSNVTDSILCEPNNILGIEYLKALRRLSSPITPHSIGRISSHYHDIKLQETYSSASAIRRAMQKNEFELDNLIGQVPSSTLKIIKENVHKRYPITTNDFSLILKYKLLGETKDSLLKYEDVSEELANRIIRNLNLFECFEQFCELLKTKEVTYSRISRALLHILLDIRKSTDTDAAYIVPEYARILGFKANETDVLSEIKRTASIPLVSKLSVTDEMPSAAKIMLDEDIFASNLYESVVADKFQKPFIHELEKQIVRE